jgi:hypothetical protein
MLGKSFTHYNKDYDFFIGLVDIRIPEIDYTSVPFEIIELKNIGLNYLDELADRYSTRELCTAVKPSFFKYFFSRNYETVVYLDPDILVYHPFETMEKELISHDIIITPHTLSQMDDENEQQEETLLNAGIYNLGFIAIKNSNVGKEMTEWWEKRLRKKAFINFEKGLFTDQIWINLVPIFYQNVKILLDKGYNVAYWNLHERFIKKINGNYFINEAHPLVFFHFSGFSPLHPEILSQFQNNISMERRQDISDIFHEYTSVLMNGKYEEFIKFPCYYDVEKQKKEKQQYHKYKKSIPIHKRIFRGLTLRFIKWFNIDADYYTH